MGQRGQGSPEPRTEEAPQWFVEAVQQQFLKLEYGQPYSEAAQKLWKLIQTSS